MEAANALNPVAIWINYTFKIRIQSSEWSQNLNRNARCQIKVVDAVLKLHHLRFGKRKHQNTKRKRKIVDQDRQECKSLENTLWIILTF